MAGIFGFASAPALGLHPRCGTGLTPTRPAWRMCERREGTSAPAPRRRQFVPGAVGRAAQADALAGAGGDAAAVADMCAAGVADVVAQSYALDDFASVFVVCGHGFNGFVGARAAVLLKDMGYRTTVYIQSGASVPTSAGAADGRIDVAAMLADANVPTCDFTPSTLDFYFDVVVDALLGVGFDGGDIHQRYWSVYELLLTTELPIVSVDVPSGWDLDEGPRSVDIRANTFLRPSVLVSLGVPKDGTKVFAGAFHFIGGRHLRQEWLDEQNMSLPAWPGSMSQCTLLSSNPFPDKGNTGEKYGQKGKFEATLWDGTEGRRRWISDEEMSDNDLWDELD